MSARLRRTLTLAMVLLPAASVPAQTIDDGMMMAKGDLCTGFLYAHDGWDRYWEGSLKRANGNIGTVTTQSVLWMGTYGVTDRLNVVAMLPYVWTNASQGVLSNMDGFQDLTLAVKYNLLQTAFTSGGTLRAFAVGSAATPASDYTPDFLPLSIGLASRRFSGRLTLNFQSNPGWFVNGTAAYTWRGKVSLDRSSYFTDGHLYLSDEVAMPDVFDYSVTLGYMKGGLQVPVTFSQQSTLGGGDIRRQDMPFVSNRMNYARVDAVVHYPLPRTNGLALRVGAGRTLSGRNVGQGTSFSGGLLYTFHF